MNKRQLQVLLIKLLPIDMIATECIHRATPLDVSTCVFLGGVRTNLFAMTQLKLMY